MLNFPSAGRSRGTTLWSALFVFAAGAASAGVERRRATEAMVARENCMMKCGCCAGVMERSEGRRETSKGSVA